MNSEETLQQALRMIEAAEASLKSARNALIQSSGGTLKTSTNGKAAAKTVSPKPTQTIVRPEASSYEEEDRQIVEGYFNGQNMIGPNEKIYPVPANYASKSKLVEGDRLKLTIMPNGSFLYKQIAPVDRQFIKGTLINEDGQHKVIANGKSYKVLLASVTYYKGQPGDEVTLIIPNGQEAEWASIEAIIPQVEGVAVHEDDTF